jgi:hypothetical protein
MEQPQEPKPTYVLVEDMTGKPPEKKGPQVIEAFGFKIHVPFPPKQGCKKCYGRGYIGKDVTTQEVVMCHKCYPMLQPTKNI